MLIIFKIYLLYLLFTKNQESLMLKVIIVDDEAKARRSIARLIEKIGNIQIVANVENASEGIHAIATYQPDIVFLDVKMPGMNGFEMLDAIDRIVLREFDVIFMTAFDEFAIRAFKYAAFDYLLKPVDEAELRETIDRYIANIHPLQNYDMLKEVINNDIKLKIRTTQGFEFINTKDIMYIEGDGSYSIIVLTPDDKRVVSRTLKDISTDLPEEFQRVHKKYIINRNYLTSLNRVGHECLLTKEEIKYIIPVSVRMMKNFR